MIGTDINSCLCGLFLRIFRGTCIQ